jgi:carboxyl-terminal processing protease
MMLSLAAGCVISSGRGVFAESPTTRPESVGSPGVGSVSVSALDLRAEALKEIRAGDFDKGAQLLATATDAPTVQADPQLASVARFAAEYEAQREVFLAERRKQFQKTVADIQKLVDAKADDFALDFATRAYVLAEDKPAFATSPLVLGIVERTTAQAQQEENQEQWVRALRLYSDLTQIQPSEPKWKEKLKAATRRLRILALYAPDRLKQIRDADAKQIEELDKIIPPATTRPAARKNASDDTDPAYKTDWTDTLKGIKKEMLWSALINVRSNYWRDPNFSSLIVGGLDGVRALVTTAGLEQTFPSLKDNAKKADFLAGITELQRSINAADVGEAVLEGSKVYTKLFELNKSTLNLPENAIVYEFADSALALCDPFTSMIWPTEMDEFNKSTQGEFSGVGISIQSDDDGSLKVVSPIEDSPAFKAGIKAGDVITHVNGKSIKGITTTQAVRIITGPPGTTVTLTIRSIDGNSKDYTLIRDTIKVASVKGFKLNRGPDGTPSGGWDYLIDPANHIAYIRLTNFTKTSGEELERACAELKEQGARALIFDLRYNPGGLLTAAIEVADRFLDHGVIVSTRPDRKTPQPRTSASARPDPDEVKIPVVVLVNQYSASASEIVSGALKDQGRAVVVGERTFGKGSVQMLFGVESRNAALKLTTSHYYLPSGRCLHREENSTTWGVDPDVKVELTPEQMAAVQRARSEMDVLKGENEAPSTRPAPTPPTFSPDLEGSPTTRPVKTPADLIKVDNQLGAALLLLRLQLNGLEVATGTPAPGVAEQR